MDEMMDNEPTLQSLEELFSSEDYIMEPQVVDDLLKYYELGGEPDEANKLLADSYQGLSQMANLVGGWLSQLESDEDGPQTSKKSAPIDVKYLENSTNVKHIFEETAAEMTLKVFNPEAADKIFENESSEGIDWLADLITHSAWRRLIYNLSEQYPQCLMLNFSVKLASDAGFLHHEITNLSTATQQLEIFSKVFLSAVEQILQNFKFGEKTKLFDDSFKEIIRVSCHDENTYLFSQALLRVMALKNTGKKAAVCRYISQVLRKNQKRQEATVLLLGLLNSTNDSLSPNVVNSFQTMLNKEALNPADVNVLYQAYFEPGNQPPIDLVRDPIFIDILVNSLFNVNAKLNNEFKPKYVFLLAYASSVCETVKNGLRVQTKIDLDFLRERINELLTILHASDELLPNLPHLLRLIKQPCLARCALHFVETTILKDDFLAEPQTSHLIIIDQIVVLHSNLRHIVFTMLSKFYENQSLRDEIAEIIMSRQKVVIDRFVYMLAHGYLPVLEWISTMYEEAKIDTSLVRYFGVEVFEIIDLNKPISNDFVSSMLPIVLKPEIFDRNTLQKHEQVARFIDKFASSR